LWCHTCSNIEVHNSTEMHKNVLTWLEHGFVSRFSACLPTEESKVAFPM
jgi:hypothetical protein